jgi:hypothetical protein
MCHLRHLLVLVHCANLDGKEGCVFTDKEEADSCTPSQANKWKTPPGHKHFCDWLKNRASANLNHGDMVAFGAHSCRATFCLFFLLSGGDFHGAMRNGRHLEIAMGCCRNAIAMKDKLEADWRKNGAGEQWFPPHRDILIHQDGELLQRINQTNHTSSNNDVGHLMGAAELFVQKMLHVSPNHPKHRDPQHLLELA